MRSPRKPDLLRHRQAGVLFGFHFESSQNLWSEMLSGLVSVLFSREPLHVALVVPAALAQRHNMVHLAVLAVMRLGVDPLELGDGTSVLLEASTAVPGADLTLDQTRAAHCGGLRAGAPVRRHRCPQRE